MPPAFRMRKQRKLMQYSRQARDWFAVLASAAIIAMALVTMTFLVVILAGCTAMTHEQQVAAAAQAKGCYCGGSGCDEIKSASGQAAVAASGGKIVHITEVRRKTDGE